MSYLGPLPMPSITDTSADDVFADITEQLTSTDPDIGDVPTYFLDGSARLGRAGLRPPRRCTAYRTLLLSTAPTGAYKFVADNAAIQTLDSDDPNVLLDFDVSVSDGDSTDSDTLTITIYGANDAPVSGGPGSASGSEDDASIGGNVPAAI